MVVANSVSRRASGFLKAEFVRFNWPASGSPMHDALQTPAERAMTPLVFIDGDQGTTGLQMRQRLAGRTDLRLLTTAARTSQEPAHRAEALNDCDVALLCLPDDAAREAVALVRRPGVRVIDASSAHRTAPGWVYGLPELAAGQAARIAAAQRISNPGCYPTGALALLRPLVDEGLLPPTTRWSSTRCRAIRAGPGRARGS
jgi:N-acetyl-gamma-glutamyl-phosphate reductase uncommon form